MGNPFQKHGLDHLSPSALNCYAEQPAFWLLKYLYGYRDDGSPAAWRGSAVEAGLDHWLYRKNESDPLAAAFTRFELDAMGLCDDATDRERNRIAPMLAQAIGRMGDRPPPTVRQLAVEYWFDGIEIPIVGKIDYEWEEFGTDLKTAGRMPSQISSGHARQISLYQAARRKPYNILYVTTAKAEFKSLSKEETEESLKRLEWYAHKLRGVLAMFSEKSDLAGVFVPDFDHYFWRNEESRIAASEVWK